MAEPGNAAIPVLLAKLLIRQGRHPDAHAVLAALPPALRTRREIRRLYTHLELIMTARDGGNAGNAGAVPGATARDGGNAGAAVGSTESARADAGPAPDEHAARFALGARCVVADDYATALGHFAELDRRAPGYRDGLAHEALLLVMDLLGPDDEQVRRYRRSLFEH